VRLLLSQNCPKYCSYRLGYYTMPTTQVVVRQRREETIARGGGAHLPQQRAWCVGGGALWMESISSVRNAWDPSLWLCTLRMAHACVRSVRRSFIAPALDVAD
jgi:hypothetical protein